MKASIILTGFMGTGKSTVGRILAEQSGRQFIDTDDWIEAREGRSITRIFTETGEILFRQLEHDAAQEFSGRENLVIATGGRMMLDPVNADLLSANAHVLCLQAVPAEILRRIDRIGERRPLLSGDNAAEKVRALLAERAPAYARFSPVETTGKHPQEVAASILADLPDKPVPIPAVLQVSYPAGHYNVVIGANIVNRWRTLAANNAPVALITDSNVGPLHAERFDPVLAVLTIPAGEKHKNLATVQHLYDQLLAAGLDRAGVILALGGGVVGDVAGFVAATYLRGIPVIQCPTTLLAMVDASVGAKTGVDLPQGKNLVGAFKQPEIVIADVSLLSTLPPEEFAAGLAEVVKSGLIAAPALLAQLETYEWDRAATVPGKDILGIQTLITGAIRVKRDIVQADPFEQGRRALLNLGHTFAHAIEQVSNYYVRHGEAVAMGLVAAANLSARLGYCPPELETEISAILARCALPTRIPPSLAPQRLLEAMGTDKKKSAGKWRFILLRGVGDVFIAGDVPQREVLATLQELSA